MKASLKQLTIFQKETRMLKSFFSFRLQKRFFYFGLCLLLIPLVQACDTSNSPFPNTPTQNSVVSSSITSKNTALFTPIPTLKSVVPTSTTVTANNTNTLIWQLNWLNGIPCQLPCWEGIIPNVTSVAEALKILNQNSLIKNATLDSNPKSSVIEFDWTGVPKSSDALYFNGGGIKYDAQTPNQTLFTLHQLIKILAFL